MACAFFTTVGAVAIIYAMPVGDYQMEYVWQHSDRDMPLLYKIGAPGGGQSGSLLLGGAARHLLDGGGAQASRGSPRS
ncbi:MAG: hypothetical protein U0527_15730 [Candidatus Eisenbacteria bacterium]